MGLTMPVSFYRELYGIEEGVKVDMEVTADDGSADSPTFLLVFL